MVARHFLAVFPLLLFSGLFVNSQVSLTGPPYSQNFNALANSGSNVPIVNNAAPLVGWYSTRATYNPDAGTNNNGGQYSYGAAGNTDRSWGSRSSGSTSTMYFGVVMQNNTGNALGSVTVNYTGEQWRLAEKGTTSVDALRFFYRVAASITDLTTGTWTAVPALDFNQVQNNTICGSSGIAIDGNLLANRTGIAGTFGVTVAPGEMIAVRWEDVNDPCNDHGLAVDDLVISYTPLPVVLSKFAGMPDNGSALLEWETASESQNMGFVIEKSSDGTNFSDIGFVEGNGTTNQMRHYQFRDDHFTQTAWYRLRQMDFNGSVQYSDIVELRITQVGASLPVTLFPNPFKDVVFMQCDLCGIFDEQEIKVKIVTSQGQLILETDGSFQQVSQQLTEKTAKLPTGIYWVEIAGLNQVNFHKIVKQ